MGRFPRLLLGFAAALALALAAPAAEAKGKAKVSWETVEVPPSLPAAKWIGKQLDPALKKATKRADFGSKKHIELRARVKEWSSVTTGDVHRVSCTIVGRFVGGPRAKSRISFGGPVKDKAKLEKQVVEMVANGLVSRLATIAREQEKKSEKS
jgi:hypothetical protein